MTNTSPRAVLHNVNLLVKNVAASRDFYQEVFGLTVDERRSAAPAMLILQGPSGTTLSLKAREAEDQGKLAGPGDVELGFSTNDLEACHATLERYGVHLTPIMEMGFGRTLMRMIWTGITWWCIPSPARTAERCLNQRLHHTGRPIMVT